MEFMLVSPREVRRVLPCLLYLLTCFYMFLLLLMYCLQDVFQEDVPHGLPLLRGIENHIDLTLGATLSNRAAYRTNPDKAKEIQKLVAKLIEKGWVRESMSLCAMPVILVPKRDGTWKMCTNYRPINNITVRYRHSIPCFDYLLNELDVHYSGYHQIRVKEGDKWKTTFMTKFRLYA
ncbi:hypothetical protein CR513_21289, partial [Mucuna pruriens]